MLEITPLTSESGNAAKQVLRTAPAHRSTRPHSAAAAELTGDQVELSAAARNFDAQVAGTLELDERLRDLREQIAKGTYLTPDKIDYVVERLHAEVFASPVDVA